MSYYDATFYSITPFDEEWIDPFDNKSILDITILSQLVRAMNNFEVQIGTDILPSDTLFFGTANRLTTFFGIGNPTDDNYIYVDTSSMPSAQYINGHRKILIDLNTKLSTIAHTRPGEWSGGQYSGYKEDDDQIYVIYPPSDTSSTFAEIFIEICDFYDVKNPLVNSFNYEKFIDADKLDHRQYWGKIIKCYQEFIDNIVRKKSVSYLRKLSSVNVTYKNNSTTFNYENFDLIQRTDHGYFTTNGGDTSWIDITDGSPTYEYPGNTGFNECPDVITSYDNSGMHTLGDSDTISRLFIGTYHQNSGGESDYWVVSGFQFNASDEHPIRPEVKFPSLYSYPTSYGSCYAGYGYQNWLGQNRVAYCRNMGWFKNGGCQKKYIGSISVSGVTTWSFENAAPSIEIGSKWIAYPTVYPHSKSISGNTWTHYNQSTTKEITVSANSTGYAYLNQPIVPLPTLYYPRTYGGYVKKNGWTYTINGIASRGNFYTLVSPGNKYYFENSQILPPY